MFRENMHLFLPEIMNRLSWLLVVCPSKVSENLVNFYFIETMAKITYIWRHFAQVLRTKQKIWKMFRQDKQFNLSKTAIGQHERQSIVWEKCRKTSLNLDSHGKPQKICLFDAIYWNLFFPNLKNWKLFRKICISLYRKHEQIVMYCC